MATAAKRWTQFGPALFNKPKKAARRLPSEPLASRGGDEGDRTLDLWSAIYGINQSISSSLAS